MPLISVIIVLHIVLSHLINIIKQTRPCLILFPFLPSICRIQKILRTNLDVLFRISFLHSRLTLKSLKQIVHRKCRESDFALGKHIFLFCKRHSLALCEIAYEIELVNEPLDANRKWSDYLKRCLHKRESSKSLSVVLAAINFKDRIF